MLNKSTNENKIDMGDTHHLITILETRFKRNQLLKGVEVGVYQGDNSVRLLKAFPKLELIMVDSWTSPLESGSPEYDDYIASQDQCAKLTQQQYDAAFLMSLNSTKFAEHRRRIDKCISWIACVFLQGPFDFVYLDAEHTYSALKTELSGWWLKLYEGGILAGHDYFHEKNDTGHFGVKRAVDEFAERHKQTWGVELHVKTLGTNWYIIKT